MNRLGGLGCEVRHCGKDSPTCIQRQRTSRRCQGSSVSDVTSRPVPTAWGAAGFAIHTPAAPSCRVLLTPSVRRVLIAA